MSIPCSRYRTVNGGWLQAVGWEQVHVSAHLGTQAEGAGPLWGMPFLRQRAQERKAWQKPAMPLESPGQEWWQDTSAHSLMPDLQDRIKPSPQGSKFFPRKCPAMNSASDFLQKFYAYKVICGQQSLLRTGRKWEDRGGVFLVASENSRFEFCHSWVSKSFLCTPSPHHHHRDRFTLTSPHIPSSPSSPSLSLYSPFPPFSSVLGIWGLIFWNLSRKWVTWQKKIKHACFGYLLPHNKPPQNFEAENNSHFIISHTSVGQQGLGGMITSAGLLRGISCCCCQIVMGLKQPTRLHSCICWKAGWWGGGALGGQVSLCLPAHPPHTHTCNLKHFSLCVISPHSANTQGSETSHMFTQGSKTGPKQKLQSPS